VAGGVIFVLAAALAAALVWRAEERRLEQVRARAVVHLADKAHEIGSSVDRALTATYALAALVRQGRGDFPDFEAVAREMLPFYPGAAALQLAPGGVVQRTYPLAGNERALGHDLLADPARTKEAFLARDTGRLTLAGPFFLIQGGVGAIGRLPVFLTDPVSGASKFWGFTNVLIRFPDVLADAHLDQLLEHGLQYELWRVHPDEGERQTIYASGTDPLVDPIDHALQMPNGTWTLSVAPVGGWYDPVAVGVNGSLGLLFSLLLAWLVKQTTELRDHRRGLRQLVAERTAELAAREADLSRAQAVARIGSWVLERNGGTLRCSAEARRILELGDGESFAASALLARVPAEERETVEGCWRAALSGTPSEIEHRVAVGETVRWVRQRAEPVLDGQGTPTGALGTVQDITERKRSEDVIWRQANFDALTGLANRNLLQDRLEQAFAHARRGGSRVGLILLDLDGFKWINETLGHGVGDELLAEVAHRLLDCVRRQDTVARLGGDEFTLVVADLQEAEALRAVADKVLEALHRPVELGGVAHRVSASLGVTLFPDDGEDAQSLLRNADIAMYRSKELGRNRYQFYSQDMQEKASARVQLESELRDAVEHQAFEVYYQPVVAASDGRLIGAEALVRWHHPERGLVSPAAFIPVAEETGLIVPLGEWVLREAARRLRYWNAHRLVPLRVAVNVSGVQFREPGLPELIARVCAEEGIDSSWLLLEITESVLMDSSDQAERRMHEIKALGVGYALDDFGTGFSSLSYLKRFPVDIVKIDRSFVGDLPDDRNDAHLVEAIIHMARSLGLRVTAEGVETDAQREFLRSLGCDHLQGYLLGKPLPANGFEQLLPDLAKASGASPQGPDAV